MTQRKEGCAIKRIPDDVYYRNTQLCKSYYKLKKRRKAQEREILYASSGPGDGMPHGSGTGDPTAQKAEKLLRLLAETDRQITAVEKAYNALPDLTARELIRLNLFDGVPMHHIPLPISESTMKRIRADFVRQVAENMGEA